MLRRTSTKKRDFEWIDLVDPSSEELQALADDLKLPPEQVKSSLDPEHLPMLEPFEYGEFMIVRHADAETFRYPEADTMVELTRKIAIFVERKLIVTIHRKDQPFLKTLFDQLPAKRVDSPFALLSLIFQGVLRSYEAPLAHVETEFERFENQIFDGLTTPTTIKDLYFLKRKVGVYKRMIRQTIDVIFRVSAEAKQLDLRLIREEADRMFFFGNELEDDVSHLLDTHLLLASNRTNDTVRVLTLFSVFFMPLTFIVGVYGMNFRFLPELEWRYGYAGVWGLMIVVSFGIYLWFRRKGWL